jgi:hypothetical protein
MAYDEELADRIRNAIPSDTDVAERKMFGGLAFLLNGRQFWPQHAVIAHPGRVIGETWASMALAPVLPRVRYPAAMVASWRRPL